MIDISLRNAYISDLELELEQRNTILVNHKIGTQWIRKSIKNSLSFFRIYNFIYFMQTKKKNVS